MMSAKNTKDLMLHEAWETLNDKVQPIKNSFEDIDSELHHLCANIQSEDKTECAITTNDIKASVLQMMMELTQCYVCCLELQNTLRNE